MMLPPTVDAPNQTCAASGSNATTADAAAWSGAMTNAGVGVQKQETSATVKATSTKSSSKIDETSGVVAARHDTSASDQESGQANIGQTKLQPKTDKQSAAESPVVVQQGHKDKAKTVSQTPNAAVDMLSGAIAPQKLPAADAGGGQQEVVGESVDAHDGDAGRAPNVLVVAASAGAGKPAASDVTTGRTELGLKKNVIAARAVEGGDTASTPGVAQSFKRIGLGTDVNQAGRAPTEKGDASLAAVQSIKPIATSTMESLMIRGVAQKTVNTAVSAKPISFEMSKKTDSSSVAAVFPLSSASTSLHIQSSEDTTEAVSTAAGVHANGNVDAGSASALAATVTAMQQVGQSHTVLRLDPPGLGNMSVHLSLGQHGQVNVLFMPDTSAGAQALQSGLGGLGQSMAQVGLTLGQAQVGGQFGQNAQGFGQNARQWQGGGTSTPQTANLGAGSDDRGGVSAYA